MMDVGLSFSNENNEFQAYLANFGQRHWEITARIRQINLKPGYRLYWGQRNHVYNHSTRVGRQVMGVGQRFLTKIVIFMPIWPILPLKLGYSDPKKSMNRRNAYQINWGQSNNVNNQSKLVLRQNVFQSAISNENRDFMPM